MALHTKKDFASLCGLTTGNLSVYKDRGKVVYSGDYIDDGIEPNKSFLLKRQSELKGRAEAPQTTKTPVDRPQPANVKRQKADFKAPKAPNVEVPQGQNGELFRRELENVTLKNEKLQEEIDILKKKRAKIDGESVPTDLAKGIVGQLVKALVSEYRDLTDLILLEIGKQYTISIADDARYRGFILDGLNKSTDRAVNNAKREIRKVTTDMANKRGVGEHD